MEKHTLGNARMKISTATLSLGIGSCTHLTDFVALKPVAAVHGSASQNECIQYVEHN